MGPRLYGELTPWYRLLTPPSEYVEEAACYREALLGALGAMSARPTLLELGAGAGHNAYHIKDAFDCTLTDLSPAMLDLSRAINPTCEHVQGDMRSLRLGRTFDAVMVHDAIMYMTTESDLAAAIETASAHTRSGGAALFAPDYVKESFRAGEDAGGSDEGSRGMRYLEWVWDPDPNDTTYIVDYAFLLRDGLDTKVAHDRHVEGLFPRATWTSLLEKAGYQVESIARPIGEGVTDQIFLCRRR